MQKYLHYNMEELEHWGIGLGHIQTSKTRRPGWAFTTRERKPLPSTRLQLPS